MRVGVLLFALLIVVTPAVAKGSRGGHRSSGSHSYSSHSSHVGSFGRTHSYRSSGSSYRGHSSRSRTYSSHRSYGHHSTGTKPSGSRSSTYGSVPRDNHGRIKRSEAAKDAFRRRHPCPSTGKSRGACPGYVIDHVKPLANGGADAPNNMQWQTKADAKAKDKWERKR